MNSREGIQRDCGNHESRGALRNAVMYGLALALASLSFLALPECHLQRSGHILQRPPGSILRFHAQMLDHDLLIPPLCDEPILTD